MPPAETSTSVLREEHQWILKVAAVLSEILTREDDGRGLDFDSIEECVVFFRLFADACHHGKEEDLLFPELESRGMPRDAGPIAVMLYEHQQGRAYVKHMADALPGARAGDEQARKILVNSGRGYIDLIRGHILKEDNVLFNMADQLVSGPACRTLCDAYGVVCARHFEGHTKEQLESLASRLADKYDVSAG
jgi:hemerythrin-like domain-containing protein